MTKKRGRVPGWVGPRQWLVNKRLKCLVQRPAMRLLLSLLVCCTSGCQPTMDTPPSTDPASPALALSGYAFQAQETQVLQDDAFANPGYLWVDRGAVLWAHKASNGSACADCHATPEQDMAHVAATYPQYDATAGGLLNVEGRINACRTRYQHEPAYAYESEALLSITAYLNNLGQGEPMRVAIDGPQQKFFRTGQRYYYQRLGQMNLSCAQCHEYNVGRYLRGDLLSQGQSVGYPVYRLDWQTLGSLHRRLRSCNSGVRAEPLTAGAPTYLALELYLAWRARGLPTETPAVRR